MKHPHAAGAVITACSLAACRPAAPDAKHADDSATLVVVPASQPSATGTSPAVTQEPARSQADAVEPLLRTEAWSRVRAQWRRLDELQGPGQAPSTEAREIGQQAEQALDSLERDPAAAQLPAEVLRALRALVATRVAVLSGLEFRLMVSHIMPSDAELARAHVGASLEQRIDALLELRKSGAVSGDELRRTLGAIFGRVHLLMALRASGHPQPGALPRAETLDELEAAVAARRGPADGGQESGLAELERAIEEARRLAPYLERMVAELER